MIHRIMGAIRRVQGASGFEGYLETLQRLDSAGAPARSDARRDYLELVRLGRNDVIGIY